VIEVVNLSKYIMNMWNYHNQTPFVQLVCANKKKTNKSPIEPLPPTAVTEQPDQHMAMICTTVSHLRQVYADERRWGEGIARNSER
jgi:hypothetical protein